MLLYARKRGRGETLVVEIEGKEALKVMRENRGCDFQLGMLGSTDLNTAVKVYGEFAPYKKVQSVQELLAPFITKQDSTMRSLVKEIG